MLPLLEQQQLPAGWTQTSVRGGEMGVRNDTHQLILQAEQIRSSNQRDSSKKNNDQWEFKLIDTVANKFTTCYLLGIVPTKRHAVEVLLTAMKAVNNYEGTVPTSHRRRITLFRERIRDECPLHQYK